MSAAGPTTLFHFSFAVSDLDQARRFYGEILGCPEGRKLPGRADFNFFGHHIVAHLSPGDVVGDQGKKIGGAGPNMLSVMLSRMAVPLSLRRAPARRRGTASSPPARRPRSRRRS